MGARASLVALALAAVTTSCTSLPWGSGGLGEDIDATAVDPNGLTYLIGPEGIRQATTKLGTLLPSDWDEGLPITGSVDVPVVDGDLSVTIHWTALLLDPGPVKLALADGTLRAEVGVRVETTEIAVDDGITDLCRPTVTIDSALLTVEMALSADKRGRVVATVVDTPSFDTGGLSFDFEGCGARQAFGETEAWSTRLTAALAADAAAALGPELVAVVPSALGLDVAVGVAATVAADAIGAGFVRATLEATQTAGGPAWSVAAGVLSVPFAVGLDADLHPCVPALTLPPMSSAQSPTLDDVAGRVLLVSGTVVQRAFVVAWASGAICGPRLTRDAWLDAPLLAVQWPALAGLPDDATVRMHLWPRALPTVTLRGEDDADEGGQAVISTGAMEVDLYGRVDDAEVRLATTRVEADVTVAFSLSEAGAVLLTATDVEVRTLAASPGLLAAPSDAVAARVVGELAREWLDGRALFTLPGGAVSAASGVIEVHDGFIAIGR